MRRLTIEEAAAKPNCPYAVATLRDFIKKGVLRRIVTPGGEGEFIKIGSSKSSPIRIIEERFDAWLHKRTYPGSEAERRGVPLAMGQGRR